MRIGAAVALGLAVGCGRAVAPAHHGAKSDHFDGQRFFNYERTSPGQVEDFLRGKDPRRQRGHWDSWQETATDTPPPRVFGGRIRITFVNHSTVLVQTDSLNLLVDPVWSDRVSPFRWSGPKRHRPPGIRFEDLPPIDVVLLTHDHYDHMDMATLRRLAATFHPRIITGLGNAALLAKAGVPGAHDIDWWQSLSLTSQARVVGVPARHWSGRGPSDVNRTLWLGFVLETPSGRIYFAGDTGLSKFFTMLHERFPSFRLGFLPIAPERPRDAMAPRHLSAREAVGVAESLHVETTVAIHFGTFRLGEDGQDEPVDSLKRALIDRHSPPSFLILRNGDARWIPTAACKRDGSEC